MTQSRAMAKKELRWVPPEGWPIPPEGWSPPPGWQPDPAWPPPPPDWQWWQLSDRTRSSAKRDLTPQAGDVPIDAALVASLDAATQRLAEELKRGSKEVARLRAAVSAAAKPRKLLAIGTAKRVVLYETEVKLTGQVVPLSPSLRATAMTSGVKRDRVFQADEDRRELTLTVDWPGGSRTLHWERNEKSVFGAMVEPTGLHNMAAAINTAAARSPEVKSRLTAATASHKQALAEGCGHARAVLERALGALHEAQHPVANALASLSADAEKGLPRSERAKLKTARHTLNAAQALDGRVGVFLQSLESQPSGPMKLEKPDTVVPMRPAVSDLHSAKRELAIPGLVQGKPVVSDGHRGEMDDANAPNEVNPSSNSDIDLLERLARLHEQGVVSTEEFAVKKAEILGRL